MIFRQRANNLASTHLLGRLDRHMSVPTALWAGVSIVIHGTKYGISVHSPEFHLIAC
jgi:hypothetical protein